ncbi:MAG: Lrp/AsnC family transcriptional regulator [Chloroflexota bacterium]
MVQSSHNQELDELDRAILCIVQVDGRISNVDLARQINLSPPATHTRLRRLEQQGYIQSYAAVLNREKNGYDMLCFVSVSLQVHQFDQVTHFRAVVSQMPEVLECHHVTGEFDYLLKVVLKNRRDLERFVVNQLTPIPGVARIYTSLVLTEVKVTTAVPIRET